MREAERNAPFGESVRNWCVSLALHTPYINHSINTPLAAGCAFGQHRRLEPCRSQNLKTDRAEYKRANANRVPYQYVADAKQQQLFEMGELFTEPAASAEQSPATRWKPAPGSFALPAFVR